jgi:hypothetical protein
MKKYKYHLLAVAVLLVAAIIIKLNDKSGTLKASRDHFAVTDTSKIESVLIKNPAQQVLLERTTSGWQVNQKFNARRQAIKALMNQLMNIEISAPVNKSMKTIALQSFAGKGLTIIIKSTNGHEFVYQIAENDSLSGTLAKIPDENEPYLVSLPGYRGPLTLLFPLAEEVWRDNTLYRYKPSDIISIEITYPEATASSFRYHFVSQKELRIERPDGSQPINIDKETARNYLLNFALVTWEKVRNRASKPIIDSLKLQKELCRIDIKTQAEKTNSIRLFRIPEAQKSNKFDPNKMYAVSQNDTVVMQVKYIDFDPIMKTYSDFTVQ